MNLYVYLIGSRNKDNKEVEGFKERSLKILEYEENEDKVLCAYDHFVKQGVPGEKTRLYKSVNRRDEDKIRKALLVKIISEEPSMTKLNSLLTSVARQTENRAESKWLFDFDELDGMLLSDFVADIKIMSDIDAKVYPTPHGYAVIVDHGFDTRELMEKWKDYDITLKRDDMLFMDMKTTGVN